MIGNNDRITKGQNAGMIISSTLGAGILSLPSTLGQKFGTDGWIMILIGGILTSLLVIMINNVTKKYKGQTFVEFGNELLPTPISFIISVIFIIYLLVLKVFVVRIFAEVIKMFLLKNTPTEVIIISILLVSAYAVRKGVESIARMVTLIIPIVLVPLLLIMLSIIPEIQLDNLLPVFRINFKDIIKGIPVIFFSYLGYEILLFTTAYVDNKQRILRYNLLAVCGITLVYLLFYFITLSRFGSIELTHLLWPTLSLMKTIDFPGAFVENVEGIVMSLWVLVIFANIGPSYYGITLIISKILKAKEHNFFVLPVLPIIYFLTLVPDNLAVVYDYMEIFAYYLGTFAAIVVPVLYFVISIIRRGKKGEAAKND